MLLSTILFRSYIIWNGKQRTIKVLFVTSLNVVEKVNFFSYNETIEFFILNISLRNMKYFLKMWLCSQMMPDFTLFKFITTKFIQDLDFQHQNHLIYNFDVLIKWLKYFWLTKTCRLVTTNFFIKGHTSIMNSCI